MDVEEFMGKGFADILNADSSDDNGEEDEGKAEEDVEEDADAGEADVGSGEELSDVSDDEDTVAVSDANEAMGNEIIGHKKSLAKLAKEQPEFYKYLVENDQVRVIRIFIFAPPPYPLCLHTAMMRNQWLEWGYALWKIPTSKKY